MSLPKGPQEAEPDDYWSPTEQDVLEGPQDVLLDCPLLRATLGETLDLVGPHVPPSVLAECLRAIGVSLDDSGHDQQGELVWNLLELVEALHGPQE